MTLLQLLARFVAESGTSNLAPSTAQSQTGELGRMVNWLIQSWTDIQSEHQDWQWLRSSMSFTTVAGQAQYQVGSGLDINLTNFGKWAPNTFRNYPTSVGNVGEIFMNPIDYEAYRNAYQYGATRTTQSRPIDFAVGPDKAIWLGPVPAAGYTVTGDYYTAPVVLSADSDEPAIPSQYHMVIVYRAMIHYGMFEAATEVLQRGQMEYDKMIRRITADRLPTIAFGGALC